MVINQQCEPQFALKPDVIEMIEKQSQVFSNIPLLSELFDIVPNFILILNASRQIVFANCPFLDFVGTQDKAAVIGRRPGDVLNCIHADEEGGCGATESCAICGANRAILTSRHGNTDIQEGRISQKDGSALDLQVRTCSLNFQNERYTFFVVQDISHEKRRRALERVFFHDIMNTISGLYGLVHLLQESGDRQVEELIASIHALNEKLIAEIQAQRDLSAAENDELVVQPAIIHSVQLLNEVAMWYSTHPVAERRHIQIDPQAQAVVFTSDPHILSRVLENMVKNALEASAAGEMVTLGCHADTANGAVHGATITFWVHNQAFMPREVQLQVFQRSFSTKGSGRGLGTYSIKLLSERYLKGQVSFTTSQEQGTTFTACYPLTLNVEQA